MAYYKLPNDFFRIRLFQTSGNIPGSWMPIEKMTIQNYGVSQASPAYRFTQHCTPAVGETSAFYTQALHIFNPIGFLQYRLFYYPVPVTLALATANPVFAGTDLSYPYAQINSIISYRIAIEIRRKQNYDTKDKEKRCEELIQNMKDWMGRDDNRAETIKNVFSSGLSPYI